MLSRTGLGRLSPHATAILVLAANAPDMDILAAFGGAASYLNYHRNATHSLFAAPFVAILPVLAVRLFGGPIPWLGAYSLSLIGVASHLLMDWTNVYGLRLLSPFSAKWFDGDFIAVVDVWIWLFLFIGLAAPVVSRLVSVEIGADSGGRSGAAVVVFCVCLLYGFGRYLLHERAVAVLDSRMCRNEAPLRVAAVPSPLNPFRWVGLVEGSGWYVTYTNLNLLDDFDPAAGKVFYKPEGRPEIAAVEETRLFQVFMSFSQWPLWRVMPVAEPENGVLVELVDLRFGIPPQARFLASAVVDSSMHVVNPELNLGGKKEYLIRED